MKKIFLSMIWFCAFIIGVVFAQNPALDKLYSLLDASIQKDPAVAELVLTTLSKYESKVSKSKKVLISQIRTFVQAKYAQYTAPKVPEWFKIMTQENLAFIKDNIHILWEDTSPILVMEFLDFQCPNCQMQHNNQVLNELRNVEFPGQVRTAAVMFPLTWKRHELATQAAESAECAYMQWWIEIFYEHKSGLYANWLVPTMDIIRKVAQNNWLDPVRMQACIDEWIATQSVQIQQQIWRDLWVSGTPGSVIVDTRNGAYRTLRGAVQIEVFMDMIKRLLKS